MLFDFLLVVVVAASSFGAGKVYAQYQLKETIAMAIAMRDKHEKLLNEAIKRNES